MTVILPDNRRLGTIFNNDINNIIIGMGTTGTVDTYRQALDAILAAQPGVFAQNVGLPEALLYPTDVDNMLDKHLVEVAKQAWPGTGAGRGQRGGPSDLLAPGPRGGHGPADCHHRGLPAALRPPWLPIIG